MIPALAVARELRERGHSVRFIGTRRGIEAKLVPPEGFPIDWIEIGGLKRVGIRRKLATLAKLPGSVWQATRMLDRACPAAIFSSCRLSMSRRDCAPCTSTCSRSGVGSCA